MTPSSELKNHYILILHNWNKGIQLVRIIFRETNLPPSPIYDTINKFKQTNSLKHRNENDRTLLLIRELFQMIRRF